MISLSWLWRIVGELPEIRVLLGLMLVACAPGPAPVPARSPEASVMIPTSIMIFPPATQVVPLASPTTAIAPAVSPIPTPAPPPPTLSPMSAPAPRSEALRSLPGADCVPPGRPVQPARLVRILDGDTIDVQIEGRTYRVRYIGIDAPERGQAFYAEATAANRRLLGSGPLRLVRDVSETDRYGRLLRYVFAGDVFVNRALVEGGYAQVMTVPPDVSCAQTFLAAEREARSAGRGLWGLPPPTATPIRIQPTRTPAPTPERGNCHPAYPTVCIPPPPPDLDCGDIPYRNFPVDHRYGDPHRFDGDKDGIGCER
ncbi:thermonuclease family protein [Thermoflexus hugenholtzii]|uniref:Micrococcal nuclease n=1 Tax=Thermoflexus hugenholtzii JAD2 TaxID=877466 RepID=A0A212QKX0_9CHLR|nr:thermonuclease family protein [Thermoflexus hugenholtzii]SNB59995.1 micrococcal nuclease [Thermoflexus hugenholtzii JAD2]